MQNYRIKMSILLFGFYVIPNFDSNGVEAQTVAFSDIISRVNSQEKQPDKHGNIQYESGEDGAQLYQTATATVQPSSTTTFDIKVLVTFTGKQNGGGSVTKTTEIVFENFGAASDPISRTGVQVAENCVQNWAYNYSVFKKVNGRWIPIDQGALTRTFLEIGGREDD